MEDDTQKRPNSNVPLSTKITGWILLTPVLLVTAIALWAVCWKFGRILIEWAAR